MAETHLPSADWDFGAIARAAGSATGGLFWPGDGNRLLVEDVTQAALDAAVAAYDHSAVLAARLAAYKQGVLATIKAVARDATTDFQRSVTKAAVLTALQPLLTQWQAATTTDQVDALAQQAITLINGL